MKLTAKMVLLFFGATSTHLTAQTVTIGFMGDVMLGRLVDENISQTSYAHPWGNFIDLLKTTDLNVINLETALTTNTVKVSPPKVFYFKATPDKVKILKEGSVTLANLANNHVHDFGDRGLNETIETLDNAGILHVGAGKNLKEAQKPVVITKNGIKIGILGFTDNEPGWAAKKNKPGINYIKVGDSAHILPLIKKVRPSVDILIISIHWGPNMRDKPSQDFIDFAHKLIDAGVDIIHGSSAHIVQPIELYKGKLIMYDTGDFIDDYAVDPHLRNDQAALFQVTVSKVGITKIKLIPGMIADMQVNRATQPQADAFLQTFRERSRMFKTHINSQGEVTGVRRKKRNILGKSKN